MSTDRVTLNVSPRAAAERGTRNVKRLRAQGFIPGVLYGKTTGSHAFAVGERELRAALSGPSGVHTVLDVILDGASHSAVVKAFQRHPVRGTATHVDLHEVRLDEPIHATVAVVLTGESPGARQGGLVTTLVRDVRVEALPTAIPDHIEVPLDGLALGGAVRLADAISLPGVAILDDLETVVANCLAPRGVADEESGETGVGATDAPAPAGDAPGADTTAGD